MSDDGYLVSDRHNFVEDFLNSYIHKSFLRRVVVFLNNYLPGVYISYSKYKQPTQTKIKRKKIRESLSVALHISPDKVLVTDHHLSHVLFCCFNAEKDRSTLIFTLDGEGSGTCATVNTFDGKTLHTLSRTRKSASLGYIYSLTTLCLGMKPLQDEFKVMGLASYANLSRYRELYSTFDKLITVKKSLQFSSVRDASFMDDFLATKIKYQRFDNVAGSLQKMLEKKVCEWIELAVQKTGIRDIALSGGVFMNIQFFIKNN